MFDSIKKALKDFYENKQEESKRKKELKALLKTEKEPQQSTDLMADDFERLLDIVDAAQRGRKFITHGNLKCQDCCSLPRGFHKFYHMGDVIEVSALEKNSRKITDYPQIALTYQLYKKGREGLLWSAIFYERVQTTDRNLFVLSDSIILKITPDMSVEYIQEMWDRNVQRYKNYLKKQNKKSSKAIETLVPTQVRKVATHQNPLNLANGFVNEKEK